MRVERAASGLTVETDSESETDQLGRALASVVAPGAVFGLIGPLGAGKTRLVRAIAEALGADPGTVSSPTFVLIHEYPTRIPIYHFDTYRLRSPAEFDDLGASDYWTAGGLCLIEWADRVLDRLPPGTCLVRIEPIGPETRRFVLAGHDGVAERLAAVIADP
jgi:tRNA threonylcarbamoyladenosine biosynthesis protein TsaE